MLLVELFPGLAVEIGGFAGKLGSVVDGEGRDADVGERKMVGAEIVALLRLAVGGNFQVQPPGDRTAPAARRWSARRR